MNKTILALTIATFALGSASFALAQGGDRSEQIAELKAAIAAERAKNNAEGAGSSDREFSLFGSLFGSDSAAKGASSDKNAKR